MLWTLNNIHLNNIYHAVGLVLNESQVFPCGDIRTTNEVVPPISPGLRMESSDIKSGVVGLEPEHSD